MMMTALNQGCKVRNAAAWECVKLYINCKESLRNDESTMTMMICNDDDDDNQPSIKVR